MEFYYLSHINDKRKGAVGMKGSIYLTLILAIAFSICIIGCKKDSATPTDNTNNNNNNPTTTGTIPITVGSGVHPTYTWTGGSVNIITVQALSGTVGPVWGITSNSGTNSIASPVTHGTVPSGAVETISDTTGRKLTTGVNYQVTVMRLDATFGTTTFPP
jgi:hypothetical protein